MAKSLLRRRTVGTLLVCALVVWQGGMHSSSCPAQDTPAEDEQKQPPRILVALPVAVAAQGKTSVTLRGLHLSEATQLKSTQADVQIKIVSRGKAEIPGGTTAEQVGDHQLEVELETARGDAAGEIVLVPFEEDRQGEPFSLPVIGQPLQAEEEENDGFRHPQDLALSQAVCGRIQSAKDVDVFRVTLDAPQRVQAELLAARFGSTLDSLLTVYDSEGRLLASNDDHGQRDSQVTLDAEPGQYFFVIQDALDRGGPTYAYCLKIGSPAK